MPPVVSFVVAALVLSIFGACFVGWGQAVRRRILGQPLYPYQPRSPVPWGLLDIGAVAAAALTTMVVGVSIVAVVLGINLGDGFAGFGPGKRAVLMLTDSAMSFVVLVGTLCWLHWRVCANLHDLGVSRDRFDSDIGLGMQAFAMLAVPVYLIQLSLLRLFPEQDQHPLVNMLKEDSSATLLMVAFFVAVVVAPIVEEVFFRVMIQGWLENVACRTGNFQTFVFGRANPEEFDLTEEDLIGTFDEREIDERPINAEMAEEAGSARGPVEPPPGDPGGEAESAEREALAGKDASAGKTVQGETWNPYQSPETSSQASPLRSPAQPSRMRPHHWPIFVSSAIFAAVHLGHGYAPIPLFFLSLGLGYLYQQTHRVVPCIVVHLLLNATSMFALWLAISYGESP